MFSALRTRYGIPGLIATVALVFAMTGGAFAAKYLITSTSQIKPSVLKKLKGATGPAGAAGAAGPVGAKGDTGAAGQNGAPGEKGAQGEKGAKGEKGAQGEPGKEGSPWTAGGTLPPGATETGTFAGPGQEGALAAIPFPIPLSAPIAVAQVRRIEFGAAIPTECAGGTVAVPKASPGYLCVYNGKFSGFELAGVLHPGGEAGASVAGAAAFAGEPIVGLPPRFLGTYAVTACGGTEFPCP